MFIVRNLRNPKATALELSQEYGPIVATVEGPDVTTRSTMARLMLGTDIITGPDTMNAMGMASEPASRRPKTWTN